MDLGGVGGGGGRAGGEGGRVKGGGGGLRLFMAVRVRRAVLTSCCTSPSPPASCTRGEGVSAAAGRSRTAAGPCAVAEACRGGGGRFLPVRRGTQGDDAGGWAEGGEGEWGWALNSWARRGLRARLQLSPSSAAVVL
jgi:hypothetical protein